MATLTDRQVDLLRKIAEAQAKVPDGQFTDFMTVSTFDGAEIMLPSEESLPLNRQDLDELIDQSLVRTTKFRQYGDINGHVTNQGFSFLESVESRSDDVTESSPLFEESRDVPIAFISYSHETKSHKDWVRAGLAERLMASGVRVILDQWHLKIGADLPQFMENAARADAVLLICTPDFARKANARKGGVGYESSIVTAELLNSHPSVEPKFLPVWRSGEREEATPHYLKSALAVDLRAENKHYEEEFVKLLRQLHREPEHIPPALGQKPDFS